MVHRIPVPCGSLPALTKSYTPVKKVGYWRRLYRHGYYGCGYASYGCCKSYGDRYLATCDDGGAMNNTLAKVTLLVFVVFFLALAVAGLWMQ